MNILPKGVRVMRNVYLVECMWIKVEEGRAYARRKEGGREAGRARKSFVPVNGEDKVSSASDGLAEDRRCRRVRAFLLFAMLWTTMRRAHGDGDRWSEVDASLLAKRARGRCDAVRGAECFHRVGRVALLRVRFG